MVLFFSLPFELWSSTSSGKDQNFFITNESSVRAICFSDGHKEERRFGNQLMSYIKAQWVAYKLKLPYIHSSFENDHLIRAGHAHPSYDDFYEKYPNLMRVAPENYHSFKKYNSQGLIPIVFWIRQGARIGHDMPSYDLHLWNTMRKEKNFIARMKYLMTPVESLPNMIIPDQGMKSIAVHVRKGGGYDLPLWSIQYFDKHVLLQESRKYHKRHRPKNISKHTHQDIYKPLKSPPEQYYVDQINEILRIYPNTDFFIHIFTDDPDPSFIVARFQERIHDQSRVVFSYRESGNRHDENIVEDILSMMNFDILIRTISSYSVFPHLLGQFELVVYPISYKWVGQCLVYNEIVYERNVDSFWIHKNPLMPL